ncbi:unnamed protein product, partial [Nesidiocoris tenuis]
MSLRVAIDSLIKIFSFVLLQDAHTVEFGDFKFGPTNITTLRLMDPQKHMVQATVHDWIFGEKQQGRKLRITPDTVKSSSALMYDAVILYAQALHILQQDKSPSPLSCFPDAEGEKEGAEEDENGAESLVEEQEAAE